MKTYGIFYDNLLPARMFYTAVSFAVSFSTAGDSSGSLTGQELGHVVCFAL